jgi:hypothetical protein
MVQRRILELKRDEITGDWRKLHDEELYNLYSSTRIRRVIKSKRMRWTEHIAYMDITLVGKSKLKRPLCWPKCMEKNHRIS